MMVLTREAWPGQSTRVIWREVDGEDDGFSSSSSSSPLCSCCCANKRGGAGTWNEEKPRSKVMPRSLL